MKKLLLAALLAGASFSAIAAEPLSMAYSVVGLYDDKSYDVPNYYVVFSDQASASYNQKTGAITLQEGYVLTLDLYNAATEPLALPAGTYTNSTAMTAFTVNPDASELFYYSAGKQKSHSIVTSDINVTVTDAGIYTVSTTVTDPESKQAREVKFSGRLPIVSVNEKPASFPMLKRDLENVELKAGGIAAYQGVSDYSNNGVTILDFFQGTYDPTTGGLTSNDGINLSIMIAHKRMVSRDKYTIVPGTYTSATSLARDTWYPCREIDYSYGGQIISIPFGSFIRIKENGSFTSYGYLKSGTLTLEFDNESRHLTGTLDAYTDLGYHVSATLDGTVTYDFGSATFPTVVSNLEDDVDLDLDYLDHGYIYHGIRGEDGKNGETMRGGCRVFTVDLGSPSGRDSEAEVPADLLRMQFFVPTSDAVLKSGLYSVVPRRWNSNELAAGGTYEPMTIGQGWSLTEAGSQYAHFKEGSWWVYDYVAPIQSGTVRVETSDYENYSFEIQLMDDAGFEIRGNWVNKPLQYQYNRQELEAQLGVDNVYGDEQEAEVYVDGRRIVVVNGKNLPVALYDLNGRKVAAGVASEDVDASGLGSGVYLLTVGEKTLKVALK